MHVLFSTDRNKTPKLLIVINKFNWLKINQLASGGRKSACLDYFWETMHGLIHRFCGQNICQERNWKVVLGQ